MSALDKEITQASDIHTLIAYIKTAQLFIQEVRIFELSRSDHNK